MQHVICLLLKNGASVVRELGGFKNKKAFKIPVENIELLAELNELLNWRILFVLTNVQPY